MHGTPTVNSCDGDWRHDPLNGCLLWTVDLVDDSNRSGSMEVIVESAPAASFFPCTVSFSAAATLCDITVPQCLQSQSQAPTRFSSTKALSVNKFEILH